MGGGIASTQNINSSMVNNYPVAIGGFIKQGDIGNGASTQQGMASATGGSFNPSFGLGLMNLQGCAPPAMCIVEGPGGLQNLHYHHGFGHDLHKAGHAMKHGLNKAQKINAPHEQDEVEGMEDVGEVSAESMLESSLMNLQNACKPPAMCILEPINGFGAPVLHIL